MTSTVRLASGSAGLGVEVAPICRRGAAKASVCCARHSSAIRCSAASAARFPCARRGAGQRRHGGSTRPAFPRQGCAGRQRRRARADALSARHRSISDFVPTGLRSVPLPVAEGGVEYEVYEFFRDILSSQSWSGTSVEHLGGGEVAVGAEALVDVLVLLAVVNILLRAR